MLNHHSSVLLKCEPVSVRTTLETERQGKCALARTIVCTCGCDSLATTLADAQQVQCTVCKDRARESERNIVFLTFQNF